MSLHNVYRTIKSKTEEKSKISGKIDLAETILNASFIKNIEFNLAAAKNDNSNLFFHLPILRSICEDIIFINYLYNVIEEEDRRNFILVYQASDWKKSIKAQEDFFMANRNFQPILTEDMINKLVFDRFDIDAIHKNLKSKYRWERKYPTVKQIATDGSLTKLYDYLYAATSRLVHFNPQTLLQMAWGEIDSSNKMGVKANTISIESYKKYYNDFCLFYGYTLFEIFTNKFKSILKIEIDEELNEIEEYFKTKRWPELITFEEMNIPLEEGRKLFHLEKNGFEGYVGEIVRINMEKD